MGHVGASQRAPDSLNINLECSWLLLGAQLVLQRDLVLILLSLR